MRLTFRPRTAIVLLLVALVFITGGSLAVEELTDGEPSYAADHVTLDDGSVLWPYTSRAPAYEEQTLSINLVVYGDVAATERILRTQTIGDWEELDEDEQDLAPAENGEFNRTTVAWGAADGATRYVEVETGGESRWLTESYQLHDGDYLGERHHIRAYADPENGQWTVLQAHHEHWDWFHLRHTVHSIEDSQQYVEEEFVGQWYVEDLRRERFGNDASSDADGWVTVIDLDEESIPRLLLSLIFGLAVVGSFGAARAVDLWHDDDVRTIGQAVALVGSILFVYMLIRFGALGIERLIPGINPKLIVAVFYPLLVVGVPIVAYLTARPLQAVTAFTAGVVGVVVALFLDYTFLGVTSLPMDTIIHRIALAIAIGLVAAGASTTARRPGLEFGYVRTGVLLWVVAVVVPLLQFV